MADPKFLQANLPSISTNGKVDRLVLIDCRQTNRKERNDGPPPGLEGSGTKSVKGGLPATYPSFCWLSLLSRSDRAWSWSCVDTR